ncbi:MAG: cytidine deaminase [Alphaproteobacteria bacterium]|nr:cytidine deaminase [Alphaproteobacteria bacterium]
MNIYEKLYVAAKQARENAYAPYSDFKVGAAILSDSGQIYSGCNVENASYPCGTCAEAGAVSAMVANGETHIREILIIADTNRILPCGNCLQKIAEFGDRETIIYSADLHQINQEYRLSDLLPQNFTLEKDHV